MVKKFLLFLILTVVASPAYSQQDRYEQLISDYMVALRDRENEELFSAWLRINEDPDALRYIAANYPWVYESYRILSMSQELARYLRVYRDSYAYSGASFGSSVNSEEFANIERGIKNNRQVALLNPNQDLPSNRDILIADLNFPLVSNQVRALRFPNQNYPSNGEILRSRLERLRFIPR